MTEATYKRKRKEILRHIAELNGRLVELDGQLIVKSRLRPRIPQWCKPPWERRDGIQHIVYCTVKRRRDRKPIEAFWLWKDGVPKCHADTMDGIKSLAAMRSFAFDTYVWDASQWDEFKASHPEIDAELKRRRCNEPVCNCP